MNKNIVLSAFVAAFLATSASAFAQDHNRQNDRDRLDRAGFSE